jgi:cell division protein FtsL
VAALFAVLVLVAGFPLANLWSQHRELSSASAQLAQLSQQNRRLSAQQHALNSKTEINRLARQDYQMVLRGQTLYDVLPAAGSTASPSPTTGGVESGDPADQPLVSPSQAPDMSPDPGLPRTPVAVPASDAGGTAGSEAAKHAVAASGTGSTFWGRVANTLEFWK